MTTYRSELKPWGGIGVEYPTGYRYQDDVPPIDAYDNNFNYHVAKDLLHLVGLTNERLDSSKNNVEPLNPTDGELWWDTGDDLLRIWDEDFGDWKVLGTASDLSSHLVDTSNPHDVTYAQAGAIQNAEGSVTESHLDFDPARQDELDAHTSRTDNPHGVTYSQAGAAPAVHDHDNRYYTEAQADSRYYTQSYLNTAFAGKSDTTHNHDSRYYKQSEVRSYVKGFPMVHPENFWYEEQHYDGGSYSQFANDETLLLHQIDFDFDLGDWLKLEMEIRGAGDDNLSYPVKIGGTQIWQPWNSSPDQDPWYPVTHYEDISNFSGTKTVYFYGSDHNWDATVGVRKIRFSTNKRIEDYY